jgi:toxin FitB
MQYLLDTCVISELVNAKPSARVTGFIESLAREQIFLSVLTLGEIREGVERLRAGPKKEKIRQFLEQQLPAWFAGNLLAIDAVTMQRWGQMRAAHPQTLPVIDSLLAATALQHDLCFLTRKVKDFQISGLRVVDPWHSES